MRTRIIVAACITFFLATSALAQPGPRVERDDPVATDKEELVFLTLAENPINFEGEDVTLQLGTPTATEREARFSAAGLPAGLSIDPQTGMISGRFGPQDAGQHRIRVKARSAARVERLTFTWIVLDRTLPTVVSPGVQLSGAGDTVDLMLQAVDDDGDDVTFAAYGLPEGLEIDATTGRIFGEIADHELRTIYTVTVVATDGHVNGGTVFTWIVLPNE